MEGISFWLVVLLVSAAVVAVLVGMPFIDWLEEVLQRDADSGDAGSAPAPQRRDDEIPF